ncbi:MAG: hypothetical protein AABZ47_08730 [Planctomycetota bacterium]
MDLYPNKQMETKEGKVRDLIGPREMASVNIDTAALNRSGPPFGGAEGVFQGQAHKTELVPTEPLHPSVFIG